MRHQAVLLAAAVLGSGLFVLRGQQPAPTGIFTAAQADAGRKAYDNSCGKCHTPTLMGRKGEPGEEPALQSLSEYYQKFIGPRGFVPPLAGPVFLSRWDSKTAAQLIARFQDTSDFFKTDEDSETTVNVTAYILQRNGAKAGSQPLTRATETVVSSVTR